MDADTILFAKIGNNIDGMCIALPEKSSKGKFCVPFGDSFVHSSAGVPEKPNQRRCNQ
jgi:hypothetical protein